MYKVLVVDDEMKIRTLIRKYAEFEGHEVIEAADGMEAVNLCKGQTFDIIIMDIMMPRLDGYSACKEIFKIKKYPTIMLSARKEEYDKLLGFDLGIDDYVTKPFSPKELMARIKAVINRSKKHVLENEIYTYETLEVNYKAHTVKIDNKEVKLTPKEYELLIYFIENSNIALSREQLLLNIWGYDFYGDDRTIDTHIKMLRNNLGKYRDLIVTVRSVGYKFETIKE